MRRISILLALVLLLGVIVGCGDGSGKVINEPTGNPIKIIGTAVDPTASPTAAPADSELPTATDVPASTQSATPEPTAAPTATPEPTATPTATPTPTPTVPPTATPTPDTSKSEQLAAIALEQEGAPHASGGTSIEEDGGFDPGGFVYYCLKQMGESYRHKSSKGYSEMDEWQRVDSMDDLLVGDLCFFKVSDSEDVNCVCIYLGDGRMIYPSKSEGKVIIVKITSDYWTAAFAWASRVY